MTIMTFTAQRNWAVNVDNIEKVRQGAITYSITVNGEPYGGQNQPTETQHLARKAFGTSVLNDDTGTYARRLTAGVATLLNQGDQVTDTVITNAIISIWNAFSGA